MSESAAPCRTGVLRIVATPLGNLADLSPRAREALAEADAIAAEDTRRTGRLLAHLGLRGKPLLSYFAPRERARARPILARLAAGQTVALVTDGGTPGICDPGARLVREARAAGARIEPVPGPCALALALSVSSAGGDRFVFEGYLPSKGAARRRRLAELAAETRTLVFYEAPHRLPAALEDLARSFGRERRATLVREATKRHEEIVESTLGQLASRFAEGARGEIVLVVEGARGEPVGVSVEPARLLDLALACGLSAARAAREVAALTGLPRSRLLRIARERGEAVQGTSSPPA